MDNKFLKKAIISFVIVFLLFGARLALASDVYGNLETAVKGTELADKSDPFNFIGGIIKAVLALSGVALAVVIIYAGIIWGFFAAGAPDKIKKAQSMIINSVIGLVIIFAAYAITNFVISNLGRAAG